jgi:hypothetical protein
MSCPVLDDERAKEPVNVRAVLIAGIVAAIVEREYSFLGTSPGVLLVIG